MSDLNPAALALLAASLAVCISVISTLRGEGVGPVRAAIDLTALTLATLIGAVAIVELSRHAKGLLTSTLLGAGVITLVFLFVAPMWAARLMQALVVLQSWRGAANALSCGATLGFAAFYVGSVKWLPELSQILGAAFMWVAALVALGFNIAARRKIVRAVELSDARPEHPGMVHLRRELNQANWGVAITLGFLASLGLSRILSGAVDSTGETMVAIAMTVLLFGSLSAGLWLDVRGIAWSRALGRKNEPIASR
ncbi:MAG: hypothetical protein JW940_19660 [Polyangiaceae bacterium]|nr:hypothetical protein [Polyangiaceae bacterium]